MKVVNTFSDAQAAIRDIFNQLELLKSKNWDRHQLRIVNAHPSVDDYDYVVRKELLEKTGQNVTQQNVTTGSYDKCTFGIAIDSNLEVANDTNPRYICAATGLTLVWIAGIAKIPSVGADIICRINKNPADPQNPLLSESILQSNFTIPAGDGTVHQWTSFDITNFTLIDLLTMDVLQIGSTTPGSGVVFVLKFKITNAAPL